MLRLLENEYQDRHDPETVKVHETFYRLRIKGSALGRTRLDAIKRGHVQDFVDKNRRHYKPASLRRLLSCVHAVLEHACEELEMIPRNPAKRIKLPAGEETVHCVLTPEQSAQLPRHIAEAVVLDRNGRPRGGDHNYPRLAAMATVLLDSGLRPGEVCGIAWNDIDVKSRILTVRRTIGRDGSIRQTKTRRPRMVELTADALAAILAQRHPQNPLSSMSVRGEGAGGGGSPIASRQSGRFVFINEDGKPMRPDTLALQLRRIREKIGMPGLTLRDFRRTFATIAAPFDPKSAQALLGHATSQMTMDVYTKAQRAGMRKTVDELEKKVGKRGLFGSAAPNDDAQEDLGI